MPLARFGLYGMRDRAQILGGSFDISQRAGRRHHGARVPAPLDGPGAGGAVDVA